MDFHLSFIGHAGSCFAQDCIRGPQFCLAPLPPADKIPPMQSVVQPIFSVDELRAQLRKMDDVKLCEFGRAARSMSIVRANLGKPPLQVYALQLQEAQAEWRRRHPKNWQSESVKEHQS
jgi:hypothetical protein